MKLEVQGQEGGSFLDVAGQGGGGSWELDSFHERHMCIVPYLK